MKKDDYNSMFSEMPVGIAAGHVYIHRDNANLKIEALSRVLDSFEPEFNSEMISYAMAKARCNTGDDTMIKKIQSDILREWEDDRISSSTKGTFIHGLIDQQFKKGYCDDVEWQKFCSKLHSEMYSLGDGVDVRSELCLYDDVYHIAGTADRVRIRNTKAKTLTGDYYDTKTGRQIRMTGDKWMLHPFNHLPVCEYTRYALQLSGYGYMGEKLYGIRVGSLSIEVVKGPYDPPVYIPVPYMKLEVEMMFKAYRAKYVISEDDENW
jgi:hypothetical protein